MNERSHEDAENVPWSSASCEGRCYGDGMFTVTPSMRRRMTVAVVACAAWLSACGAEPTGDAAVESAVDTVMDSTTPTGSDTTATVVDAADSWTSPLVGGGSFSFANARAKGPFGFWFWAPG